MGAVILGKQIPRLLGRHMGFGGGDLTTQTWDEMRCMAVGGVDDIPRVNSATRGSEGIRVAFRCPRIVGSNILYGRVCVNRKDVGILSQNLVPDGRYEAVGPDGTGPVRDGAIYASTGAKLLSPQAD